MLYVDPGVHVCGYAIDSGGRLVACGLWPTPDGPIPGEVSAVVELPQVYRAGPARTRDLIDLAAAAGRVSARCTSVRYVRPAQWKGQLPKKVQHARMWAALDENETAIAKTLDCKASLRHNVYDAICLLLTSNGRI